MQLLGLKNSLSSPPLLDKKKNYNQKSMYRLTCAHTHRPIKTILKMSRTVYEKTKRGPQGIPPVRSTSILLSGSLSDGLIKNSRGKVLSSPHTAIFIDSIYSTSPGSHFFNYSIGPK